MCKIADVINGEMEISKDFYGSFILSLEGKILKVGVKVCLSENSKVIKRKV